MRISPQESQKMELWIKRYRVWKLSRAKQSFYEVLWNFWKKKLEWVVGLSTKYRGS
jgi:hypothetical protein